MWVAQRQSSIFLRELQIFFSVAFNRSDEVCPSLWRVVCFAQKSTDLNVNHIFKYIYCNIWNGFGPNTWAHKLTHTVNCSTLLVPKIWFFQSAFSRYISIILKTSVPSKYTTSILLFHSKGPKSYSFNLTDKNINLLLRNTSSIARH